MPHAFRATRHGQEFVNAQIAFARGRRANGVSFVGEAYVQGFAIRFAKDDRGSDAELAAGAQNAYGDFTAIGDENFFKHSSSGKAAKS